MLVIGMRTLDTLVTVEKLAGISVVFVTVTGAPFVAVDVIVTRLVTAEKVWTEETGTKDVETEMVVRTWVTVVAGTTEPGGSPVSEPPAAEVGLFPDREPPTEDIEETPGDKSVPDE